MSVLAVGLNHRSAELALLDRLAISAEELPKALASLVQLEHVLEAAIISTCNRVEVYAHVSRFHPGLQEVRAWLCERGDVHPADLEDVYYSFYDDRAAAHLFQVASGIDSMVVGERQIALQVKQALQTATEEGAARRVLQKLFREAVRVGKRVRSETDISTGASSMVDVALDVVAAQVDGLRDRRVLVAGAGKIGSLTADRLSREEVAGVHVWNRNLDKAERLAARVGGQVVAVDALGEVMRDVDVVVCTTGAATPVIDADDIARVMVDRPDRPLVLLDLAMPRNIDPGCAAIEGVSLVDISAVRDEAAASATAPAIDDAVAIVEEEAARFDAWTRAVKIEPTIRALRTRGELVRQAELDRLSGRFGDLDERQREALEALTRGIVNTLLHEPSVRLKDLADSGGAEHHANALRELFDLDE